MVRIFSCHAKFTTLQMFHVYMGTKPDKGKKYKARVDARGVLKKRVVSAIGEPGRFKIFGAGIRQGIRHFSC